MFTEANSWISELIPQGLGDRALLVRVYLGFWAAGHDDREWGALQAEWIRQLAPESNG